ncbi:hypothetical protein TNCV_1863341 [Trichonephila clavipes]|nr:hypothetical protein TNCV_1863341 [Trichonephila clavipes]
MMLAIRHPPTPRSSMDLSSRYDVLSSRDGAGIGSDHMLDFYMIVGDTTYLHLPQFNHGTLGEGNILQPPAPVVCAATAHKIFGPIDLTSTYSVRTWGVFGGIDHRTQILRSGARCCNH